MMKRVLSVWAAGLVICGVLSGGTAAQEEAAAPPLADDAGIDLLPGFRAELLYTVPREQQGSWVSCTFDGRGRLIASDQYGALYRLTIPPAGKEGRIEVEKLEVNIGMAQGLLWAFDSLYVMVNGRAAEGSGLYRLRDTNGDDRFDDIKLLKRLAGGGEHGPHAVVLGPYGRSLYVVAGNHTAPPDGLDASRSPMNWAEDQLLPRMPDAGGHATDRMAPGGWVCRVSPDGARWELVCHGFRNAYDIAFNREGELFTFDSDMEWDFGLPWYRPTRVCHIVSGAEFGWRNGSGKWPVHYPDSVPAAVDIGPGSPTGIAFGYALRFPKRYQEALFICDWSYGKLYAVHLEPAGASYTGSFEQFAAAAPLPLTDIAIGPDGAMYLTVGGRRTQSALYRITYAGDEPTDAAALAPAPEAAPRELRRKLEMLHRPAADPSAAVGAVWRRLGHEDRFIRYAARIAIEHQPVEAWRRRALAERDPQTLITAMVALARQGDAALQGRLVEALGRLEWTALSTQQQLALLRAYGLAFIRMGEPDEAVRAQVIEHLDAHYPASRPDLNMELARLLGYLEPPGFIGRTLELMAAAPTQEEQIHYAYVLRTVGSGWTVQQRRRYFQWFNETEQFGGGVSFAGYLRNIRDEAAARLTDAQRRELEDVLAGEPTPAGAPPPRPYIAHWTVEDLLPAVEAGLSGRDYERGRRMFAAAQCFRCHRFDGRGGATGPDLTGVAGRFTPRDLLEAIIEPSKEVSDQYAAVIINLEDGAQVVGRIINLNEDRLMVSVNPYVMSQVENVQRDRVVSMEPSPVSPMPPGLLNTLNKEEALDLIAYLLSGGDPEHEMFE